MQISSQQKKNLLQARVKQTVNKITARPLNSSQFPSSLADKNSISRYSQPKYWIIQKLKRQANKQLLVLPRNPQVQEKIFKIRNKQIDKEFATMDITKLSLAKHNSVLIQNFKEYTELNINLEFLKTQITNLEGVLRTDYKLDRQLEKELQIQTEMYFLQLLSIGWHQQSLQYPRQQSCRIIILMLNNKRYDQNYFIYKKQLSYMPNNINEAQQFISSPQEAQPMLQIIKIHMFKDKHKQYLENLKNSFQQKLSNSLILSYQTKKKEAQKAKVKFYKQIAQKKLFLAFQIKQQNQILSGWKNKALKMSNTKNMFVEVEEIWFKKGDIPSQLKVMIPRQQRQNSSKEQKKSYVYKCSQQDYIIFKIASHQKRCFKLPLKQNTFGKYIPFKIQAKFNNKLVIFQDVFFEKNIQNESTAFTHELVLQSNNDGKKYQNCIIYFNIINSRKNNLNGTSELKILSIFKNIGEIQTKYKSSLHIQYSPQNFNLIRQLISHSTQRLNKQSFEKTYYQLAKFIQKEENLSQTSIRQSKKDSRGFLMEKRAQKYKIKLQLELQFQNFQKKDEKYKTKLSSQLQSPSKGNKDSNQLNLYSQLTKKQQFEIDTKNYKNLKEDLNRYNSKYNNYLHLYLVKFIYFISKTDKIGNLTFYLRYMSHLIPITQKIIILIFNQEQNSSQSIRQSHIFRMESNVESFYLYMAFIAKHYPYSEINNLKTDLYIIRWLIQKKLPSFNYYLNRNHIGLQNLIAPYLLTLFTSLSEQLTFRIWDYLILSNNKQKARIVIAYTLLTYFEATNTLPIIPINQFMDHVEKNMKVLSTDKQFAAKFSNIVNIYYKFQLSKKKKIEKIIKESPLNNISDDKYLNKIILGTNKPKIPLQQEGKVSFWNKNTTQQLQYQSVEQINYPLPKANYFGNHIIEMIIFFHNLNLLDNLNLMTQKYFIKFQLHNTEWSQQIQINEKDHYYNKSIVIPALPVHQDKNKELLISVLRKQDKKFITQLSGSFNYEYYYKDKAYKIGIILKPTNHHNKGRSVLNISFCLKSNAFNKKLQTKHYSSIQNICEKLLDYDVSENNETMIVLQRLKKELQRIKFPLDEFENNKYTKLQNSALYFYQSQVLQSSKASLQQLKTIFYSLFNQEEQKNIRHQFSKYYQIFAEQNNMQFAYFAEMMIKFILISEITKKKKLMYLFCLCVHYQNCHSKKINSQTLNFLIKIIYKQNMFINACPYSKSTVGEIIQAYYIDIDSKNNQIKHDFTDIIKDWAYVSNIKLANFSIILGSYRDLSILRSFFDLQTIKKIQSQPECRFQIIYQIDGSRFVWSVVVESKTFAIIKRGNKFLNNYATYGDIKYLNSTQEYLLNCENIIPLQNIKGYNYQQFTKELLSHSLISYLFELPLNPDIASQRKMQKTKVKLTSPEDANKGVRIQKQFTSWAIYRGQNCLQTWRKCKIVRPGEVISKIIFQFDKEEYSVETADIISMEETNINISKK